MGIKPAVSALFLVLALPLVAQSSRVVEIQLLENPPYTIVEGSTLRGFLPDLFAALKVPGFTWNLQLRPWARALARTRDDSTGLIVLPTLTRTGEREPWFKWISPLASPRYFFIGKDHSASLEAIKDKTIAVLLNNSSDDWLKRNGYRNLMEVASVEQMVLLVMNRRADYLLKDVTSLGFFLRSNGLQPGDLVLGPEVVELAQPLYMAGSLALEPALARGLSEEMARLKRSGELDQLWKQWQ